jgi:heme b synthase
MRGFARERTASPPLRMVAWEITRGCNLSCLHCRALSGEGPYPGELTTEECLGLVDDIASFADPIIILTGGEPMMRPDVYRIAEYGTGKGLRMVLATNGTLLNEERARRLVSAGIRRISISLDGADPETHDQFRGVKGSFDGGLRGIRSAKKVGLEFQINTTVTRHNLHQIPQILDLAVDLGAAAYHLFLLVPTGRGKDLQGQAISSHDYEEVLNWFYDQRDHVPLHLKVTCAPHYYRILRQRAQREGKTVTMEHYGLDAVTRGCLGGVSFCFISSTGRVQPCGYLELDCGNVRDESLESIWANCRVFKDLRDDSNYKGKCGYCEYRKVCGGCRARAFETTGDYLAEEPYCIYEPKRSAPESMECLT